MRRLLAVPLAALLVSHPFAQSRTSTQADVDLQSLMTTPVVLLDGTRQVSQGTGFFFASTKADGNPDTMFLATNYHVITGHSPLSPPGPLGENPRLGDRIRFMLHADPADLEKIKIIELPLYDSRGNPLWVSSDVYPAADVVLVPVPAASYAPIKPYVFTQAHTEEDIKIRPTSGATLLGYPYGFYDQKHSLPIWKTGHVATEPDVDFEGQPLFLVDVSAFPGMSGSPVMAVASGIYESEEGPMRSGRVRKLLGIFSAIPVVREVKSNAQSGLADQVSDISLQLGYVWKASLIAEMARAYHPRH